MRTFAVMSSVLCCAATLSAQELSGLAAGILEQSNLARQAVIQHNQAAALDHVRQASILANTIEKQAPAAPRPLLVPVSKEIDTTTTYRPVKRGKSDVITAQRLKKHTSIREVDSEVTTGSLDVTGAEEHLRVAQEALERGDWVSGETALRAIPESVIRVKAEADMPLLKARANLLLAKTRIVEGNAKAAESPLKTAAQVLAEYERSSPGPHNVKAEAIRQEIVAHAREVSRGDNPNALAQIDVWLEPIDEWVRAIYGEEVP